MLHQRFFEDVLRQDIIVHDGANIISFTRGHDEVYSCQILPLPSGNAAVTLMMLGGAAAAV